VVVTDALLLSGAATVAAFAAVMQVEGARRPGYDARYHTGSELELGPGGWIIRMNFFLVGAGLLAFAAGVRQALDTDSAAALLGVAGIALVLAGVFTPDPVRGFPLGPDRHVDHRPIPRRAARSGRTFWDTPALGSEPEPSICSCRWTSETHSLSAAKNNVGVEREGEAGRVDIGLQSGSGVDDDRGPGGGWQARDARDRRGVEERLHLRLSRWEPHRAGAPFYADVLEAGGLGEPRHFGAVAEAKEPR
jgi:hypothetical protein